MTDNRIIGLCAIVVLAILPAVYADQAPHSVAKGLAFPGEARLASLAGKRVMAGRVA